MNFFYYLISLFRETVLLGCGGAEDDLGKQLEGQLAPSSAAGSGNCWVTFCRQFSEAVGKQLGITAGSLWRSTSHNSLIFLAYLSC